MADTEAEVAKAGTTGANQDQCRTADRESKPGAKPEKAGCKQNGFAAERHTGFHCPTEYWWSLPTGKSRACNQKFGDMWRPNLRLLSSWKRRSEVFLANVLGPTPEPQ